MLPWVCHDMLLLPTWYVIATLTLPPETISHGSISCDPLIHVVLNRLFNSSLLTFKQVQLLIHPSIITITALLAILLLFSRLTQSSSMYRSTHRSSTTVESLDTVIINVSQHSSQYYSRATWQGHQHRRIARLATPSPSVGTITITFNGMERQVVIAFQTASSSY